jgi:3'-5' exoribonuclease
MATQLLEQIAVGQSGDVLVYVLECTAGVARNGKPFRKVLVTDRSGRRWAHKWDITAAECGLLVNDATARLRVTAKEPYKGGRDPELTIEACEAAPDADAAHFMPGGRSPAQADADWKQFGRLARSVGQPDLARLMRGIFRDKDVRAAFCAAPAAHANHHAYPGGLLEHTVEVAELAMDACRRLGSMDRDLLLTGALLHDIGKIREIDGTRPGYPFTDSGSLVGHVMLGSEMVGTAAQALEMPVDPALVCAVQHMILSHHGRKEWGAPVEPATPEAILLHNCDYISAQMFYCRDAAGRASESAFQWVPALDRRMYLSPAACRAPDADTAAHGADDGALWWEEAARPEIRIVAGGLADEDPPQMAAFPIYGCIAAGSAIRSEQNLEGYLALPMNGRAESEDFLLRVTGDSMRDAHILDGDIVRVRPPAGEPREGDIVAAVINGDATVKRFHRVPEGVVLKAENPAHADIPVTPADDFSVQGVVVGLLREHIQ